MFQPNRKAVMGKSRRILRDLVFMLSLLAEMLAEAVGLKGRYHARVLTAPEEIKLARALSTREFVARGKIDPTEVDEDGILIHDAYLGVSSFFGVFEWSWRHLGRRRLVAAKRLLGGPYDVPPGAVRMPLERLDPEQYSELGTMPNGSVAEMGATAKESDVSTVATIKLYREVFRYACSHGVEVLICAIEPKVVPRYKALFGGALKHIGGVIENRGIKGPQIPLRLDLRIALAEHQEHHSEQGSTCQRLRAWIVRSAFGDFSAPLNADRITKTATTAPTRGMYVTFKSFARIALIPLSAAAFMGAFVMWTPVRIPLAIIGLLGYAITGFTLGMVVSHIKQHDGSANRGLMVLFALRFPTAIIGLWSMNLLRSRWPHLASIYGENPKLKLSAINPVIATVLPGLMGVWILSLVFGGWDAWWRTVAIVAIGAALATTGLAVKVMADQKHLADIIRSS